MKVVAVTMPNCPKCREAKEILRGYDVMWMESSTPEGRELIRQFKLIFAPSFIITEEPKAASKVITSIFKVKHLLEEAKNR